MIAYWRHPKSTKF